VTGTKDITVNPLLPGSPQNVTATAPPRTPGSVVVHWETPASDGGGDITSYRIHRVGPSNQTEDFNISGDTKNITDSGLPDGTYVYTATARNAAGEGPGSQNATVKVGLREKMLVNETAKLGVNATSGPFAMDLVYVEGKPRNGTNEYDITLTIGESQKPPITVLTAGAPLPPLDVRLLPTLPAQFASLEGARVTIEVSYLYDPGDLTCLAAVDGGCLQYAPFNPIQAQKWMTSNGAKEGFVISIKLSDAPVPLAQTVFVPFAGQVAGAVMG
jgi:hypothetical protein